MSDSEEENEFMGDEEEEEEAGEVDEGDDDDEEEEEEEEDEPLATLRKRKSAVNYAEDDDDDDDDDDVPLASLASSSTKKAKKTTNGKATPTKTKKTSTTKATPTKKAKTTSTSSSSKSTKSTTTSTSSSSTTDFKSASDAFYRSECQKGLLVQRLLVRWWYAFEWPDPKSLPKEPPENYDAMDGFPGVYVCTQGDDVGKIQDFRDHDRKPSFRTMAKKPAEELRTLLIKALETQKKELVAAEGSGTPTEKELDNLLKWANKVKASAADKEAEKVLKAAKMQLD